MWAAARKALRLWQLPEKQVRSWFRWFRLVTVEKRQRISGGKVSQTFRVSISDISDSAVTFLVGFLISVSEE